MQEKIFDISFEVDGKKYTGWVNPADKIKGDGAPSSFHVVLNEVSFGHLAYKDCNWSISEDRPASIVKAVGKEIEKHFQL